MLDNQSAALLIDMCPVQWGRGDEEGDRERKMSKLYYSFLHGSVIMINETNPSYGGHQVPRSAPQH